MCPFDQNLFLYGSRLFVRSFVRSLVCFLIFFVVVDGVGVGVLQVGPRHRRVQVDSRVYSATRKTRGVGCLFPFSLAGEGGGCPEPTY